MMKDTVIVLIVVSPFMIALFIMAFLFPVQIREGKRLMNQCLSDGKKEYECQFLLRNFRY